MNIILKILAGISLISLLSAIISGLIVGFVFITGTKKNLERLSSIVFNISVAIFMPSTVIAFTIISNLK